ncbi:MAG: amino acid adenylation domain-containing protein [Candidatus Eremiobacteraeota bacterium]|nr:amino acid adenylation domain-containing protein [Candidatus Eremiobacteraeota bacterium]
MSGDQALLDQLLAEAGIADETTIPPLVARPRAGRLPLSFAQELLWLLDNAAPGMTAYNMPLGRRISGPLDVRALERSLSAVVARHEVLRTRFALVDGEPEQVVDPPHALAVERIDLRNLPAPERAARADAIVNERARRSFDLAREHMFRATLLRLDADEHLLLLEMHHIVSDGASIGVLLHELSASYRAFRAGEAFELPPLELQYADYALWQREALSGARLSTLLTYWRAQLGERTEPLVLPRDFPPSPAPTFVGTQRSCLLEPQLIDALQRLGRRHDAGLYMLVLALYATLLHRYTGRTDVLIGSNVAGRLEAGLENLIGYFNNTLAMRGDFAGDPTFCELLERVRDSCLGAYDHQDVPFEKLVLDLRDGARHPSHASLFDVVLSAQDPTAAPLTLEGALVCPYRVDMQTTKFDLTLFMMETAQGLRLTLRARSDLWNVASIERFLAQLQGVAAAVVANPEARVSRLALSTPEEERLIAATNATAANTGLSTVVAAFETQARRIPEATAVICGDERVTYRALNARANALAQRLRTRGVERGTTVGLVAERTTQSVAAIMGIFKAGGAYVPLEPGLPDERLKQQLTESGTQLVVACAAAAAQLPLDANAVVALRDEDASDDNIACSLEPDDLAYVLFTSGSTGVPKGVAVTHRNLASYVGAISRVLGDVRREEPGHGLAALGGLHCALTGTLAADLGNTVLFAALCCGGTVHVLPGDVTSDPAQFSAYVAAHPLDVVKITPSHLRALLPDTDPASILPARWMIFGGEALPLDFASELLATQRCRILNHYGPTEATVGATTFEVTPSSLENARAAGARTVPIGYPLANVRTHVLDANLQPLPLGVPGELFIAGAGVARGYMNRFDFTAERFSELPGMGRVYRTGDRVRRLSTGALEYLGRGDAQIKLRGYRVDLGDIEHVLARHPAVSQCAVLVRDPAGDAQPALIAYVAAADGSTPEQLRGWLAERLPHHMVPGAVVALDALPLGPSGKIDRRALSDVHTRNDEPTDVAPRTATELTLARIWTEVLGRERVGVHDHFLALGGHSLLAIRILGKLSRTFAIRLPLRALFDAPTIEKLAIVVNDAVASPQVHDPGPLPRAADATRTAQSVR